MVSPLFEKGRQVGFAEGYKKGYKDGSGDKDTVLNQDILAIYGMMAICLHEDKGWDSEQIEEFCLDIQFQWQNYSEWLDEETAKGNPTESIPDMVESITGVAFKQVFGVE